MARGRGGRRHGSIENLAFLRQRSSPVRAETRAFRGRRVSVARPMPAARQSATLAIWRGCRPRGCQNLQCSAKLGTLGRIPYRAKGQPRQPSLTRFSRDGHNRPSGDGGGKHHGCSWPGDGESLYHVLDESIRHGNGHIRQNANFHDVARVAVTCVALVLMRGLEGRQPMSRWD